MWRLKANDKPLFPLQALADQHLHFVCDSLLCVRHLRHVPVPPLQAAGERSRGHRRQVRCGEFSAQGGANGAASHLHGGLLLPCLSGNYGNAAQLLCFDNQIFLFEQTYNRDIRILKESPNKSKFPTN